MLRASPWSSIPRREASEAISHLMDAELTMGEDRGGGGAERQEHLEADTPALKRLEEPIAPELVAAGTEARLVAASRPHPAAAGCAFCRAAPGRCPEHPATRLRRYELWVRPGQWLAAALGANAGVIQPGFCVASVMGVSMAWAPEAKRVAEAARLALSEGQTLEGVSMGESGREARYKEGKEE